MNGFLKILTVFGTRPEVNKKNQILVVQGDTTKAMAASLAAFYQKVKT